MAHVISDECVMCGSCEGECPVGAISEGDGKYEIHAKLHVRQALFQQSNYKSQSDHTQNTVPYPERCFFVAILRTIPEVMPARPCYNTLKADIKEV